MELLADILTALIATLMVLLAILLYAFFFSLHPRDGGPVRSRNLIASLEQKLEGGTIDPIDAFMLRVNRWYVTLHEHYGRVVSITALALVAVVVLKLAVA